MKNTGIQPSRKIIKKRDTRKKEEAEVENSYKELYNYTNACVIVTDRKDHNTMSSFFLGIKLK